MWLLLFCPHGVLYFEVFYFDIVSNLEKNSKAERSVQRIPLDPP